MAPRLASPFRSAIAALLLASAGALPLACSSSSSASCAALGTVTATVTDIDVDDPNNFLCGATVTLSENGGSPTTLTPQGGVAGSMVNCIYVANVAPGTYVVTASKSGYTPLSQTLDVTQTACVTGSPSLSFGLMEVPGGAPDAGSSG
jgi:hypothetical protein